MSADAYKTQLTVLLNALLNLWSILEQTDEPHLSSFQTCIVLKQDNCATQAKNSQTLQHYNRVITATVLFTFQTWNSNQAL